MNISHGDQLACVLRELEESERVVRIPLSAALTLIVEERDLWLFGYWRWSVRKGHRTHYLYRREGPSACLTFHREVYAAPPETIVDHINGDGLDNRRSNLRLASRRQNNWNRANATVGASGYIGVRFHPLSGLWRAGLRADGWGERCTYHRTAEEAAHAYDNAAIAARGEFANTNFRSARVDKVAAMRAVAETLRPLAAGEELPL